MVLKSCFLLPLFVEKVSHNRIYLLIKFHVYRKCFIKFQSLLQGICELSQQAELPRFGSNRVL